MNSLVALRAVLRSEQPEALVAWLRDVFDLPVAAGEPAGLVAPGDRLLVEGPGAASLELCVLDLQRALARCLEEGAVRLGDEQESRAGRSVELRIPGGERLRLVEAAAEKPGQGEGLPLGEGPVQFTVGRSLPVPAAEAFRALTAAEFLERSYLHRASADLDAGGLVEWWWTERACGRLQVEAVEPGRAVSFTWHAHHVPHRTRVRLGVSARPSGSSRARFTESGWERDERGLSSAFAHAEGWAELLASTESLLVHGRALKPRRGGA